MVAPALLSVAIFCAGPIEVEFAADHPAPIFYTDDPLILSLSSAQAYAGTAEIYAELPTGATYRKLLPEVVLEPNRARWVAVDDLPVERGPHRVTLTFGEGGPVVAGGITRIDRPDADRRGPIGVAVSSWSLASRHLVASLAIQALRLDAADPSFGGRIAELQGPSNLRVHVRVSLAALDLEAVSVLVARHAEAVDVWEVAAVESLPQYNSVVRAIVQADSDARIAVETVDLPTLIALFGETAVQPPDAAIVHADENVLDAIDTARRALQRAGHERVPLIVECASVPESPELVQRIHQSAAAGSATLFIAQEAIISGETPTNPYAAVAAASGLAEGLEWVGPVGGGEPTVYRLPPWADNSWKALGGIQALRSDASPLVSSEAIRFEDVFGNAHALSPEDGAWPNRVVAVVGSDESALTGLWIERVNALATRMAEDAEGMRQLPPETAAAVKRLTGYTLERPLRFELFALVRALPAVEERWHYGLLEAHEALPLIASTAKLVRLLAALSEEKKEPFLESFGTTRARVESLMAASYEAYPNVSRFARLAFLRAEVESLLAEAQAWYEAGRTTEARSLAVFAEWRARCLEPAATALSDSANLPEESKESP